MRFPAVSAAVVCGFAAVVAVIAAPARPPAEDAVLHRAERARLRAHFDSVLVELHARDLSGLTVDQKRHRAQLVQTLTSYRDGGVFPHNHHFAGRRVPYFRDEHGTLCAMAHLVASTGRDDIVDDIGQRRNNEYIPELASDDRLVAWLDSAGLTAAEAARIQPQYQGPGPGIVLVEDRNPARYVVPSLALGLPAVVTTVLNWRASREKRPDAALFLGALSGAATAILGGAIIGDERDGPMRTLGIADLAVGSLALVAVVRRSVRQASGAEPQAPVAGAESRVTFDVAPAWRSGSLSPSARVGIRF